MTEESGSRNGDLNINVEGDPIINLGDNNNSSSTRQVSNSSAPANESRPWSVYKKVMLIAAIVTIISGLILLFDTFLSVDAANQAESVNDPEQSNVTPTAAPTLEFATRNPEAIISYIRGIDIPAQKGVLGKTYIGRSVDWSLRLLHISQREYDRLDLIIMKTEIPGALVSFSIDLDSCPELASVSSEEAMQVEGLIESVSSNGSITLHDSPTLSFNGEPCSGLLVVEFQEQFVCDNMTREMVRISGFLPGEGSSIKVTPAATEQISSSPADSNGIRAIDWNCEPDKAPSTRKFMIRALQSGKTLEFDLEYVLPEK